MRSERLAPYVYRWDEGCFPLGRDSLALGEFCTLPRGARVLDLGCGAGLLLLLCARREPGAVLTGVELDPHAAALARENLAQNGLTGTILTGNLREVSLPRGMDLVISNPPWYPKGQKGDAAHVAETPIPAWCAAAAGALKPRGRFALVYHPARLTELMVSLREAKLEPKRIQFCRHNPEKPPYAVLLEAVKGGRPQLSFEIESWQRKLP